MAPERRKPAAPAPKPGLHPRNRHVRGYDFARLVAASPDLAPLLRVAPHGGRTIDFADPAAVKTLNRALLADGYGVAGWDVPPGYLCPPIPGRADYLHHLADLLAEDHDGIPPRAADVRLLDVGVGASAVYPLIGHREYGWSFVGSDVDAAALASAARIVAANPWTSGVIELRRQARPRAIFAGVVQADEHFDATVCNPPFHASADAVTAASETKWRKLGRGASSGTRNFAGQATELWCEGGEVGFVGRMIEESVAFAARVRWFTTLVSSAAALPLLQRALKRVTAPDVRVIPMAQGQKHSRILAWSFQPPSEPREPGWPEAQSRMRKWKHSMPRPSRK